MDEKLEEFICFRVGKAPPFIRLATKDFTRARTLVQQSNEALILLKKILSSKAGIWTELEMLRKSTFKLKASWKQEAAYKGTKQVLKCMESLRRVKILELVSGALKSVLGFGANTLLPSQQYIQYLMTRLIGIGRLALQTIDYCVYTERHLLAKMRIGHHLVNAISLSAFISRVWVLSHTLIVQMGKSYQALNTLQLLATAADYDWLPAGVKLPKEFPVTLPENHKSKLRSSAAYPSASIMNSSLSSLQVLNTSNDATETTQERMSDLEGTEDVSPQRVNISGTEAQQISLSINEDAGQLISRESFQNDLNQAKQDMKQGETSERKKRKKKRKLSPPDINTEMVHKKSKMDKSLQSHELSTNTGQPNTPKRNNKKKLSIPSKKNVNGTNNSLIQNKKRRGKKKH